MAMTDIDSRTGIRHAWAGEPVETATERDGESVFQSAACTLHVKSSLLTITRRGGGEGGLEGRVGKRGGGTHTLKLLVHDVAYECLQHLEMGSVMASKPKTMPDAIEFATELMDQKIRTFAERTSEKLDL
ncbi:hypothetical protein Tco_0859963 [Tanacetum coccineum]|uniref:Uncharacterized protein n=1 Tax=Tanacetum coccineum TaxID=301880 RepID=A0ABQ5BDI8_9ASTR